MIGDVLVRIGADISDYRRNLKTAGDDLQKFGSKMESTGTSIATTFGAIAVASAAGIGVAVKAASDYESAFAGVRKVLDASEKEFQDLSRAIQDMSKEIPASAEEIASVAEISGQLGIAKDDLMAFTRTMIDIGISTNMSAEEAATALARLANITGMSMKDIDRLGSTVVDLGNNLATTESEIVEMGLRLAGAGNQIGLTEAQILSFAGALSSVGIEAEAGGTAFSRVFLNMNTAVMNGGKELANFAKVAGMSSSDFAKAFENDAASAIMTFISGLDTMSKEGANTAEVLADLGLGEIRVRDALMRAAGASGVFSNALQIGNKAWDENNALSKEASNRYATFASKVQVLRNRISGIIRNIGGPFMETLSGMIDALDPVISAFERFAEWFANSSSATKTFITTMVITITILSALAAGFGIFLIFIGMVTSAVGTLALVFGGLGATILAGLKIAAITTGIGAIIAIIVALTVTIAKNWDSIGEKTSEMVANMKTKLAGLPETISGIASKVGEAIKAFIPEPVLAFLSGAIDKISESFSGLVSAFKSVMSGDFGKLGEVFAQLLPTIIGFLVGGIPGLIIAGSRFLPAIAEGVSSNADAIVNAIDKALNGIVDGVSKYLPKLLASGIEIIEKILTGILKALPSIVKGATTLVTSLVSAITKMLPTLITAGVSILSMLLQGIVSALPLIVQSMATLIQSIVGIITTLLPVILEVGIQILTTIINGIVQALPLIIGTVLILVTTFIETVITLLPMILESGIQLLLAIIQGIVDSLPQLISAIITVITTLTSTIIELLPEIIAAGIEILIALIDGIINALPQLIEAALTLILSMASALIENLPKIIAAGVEILIALVGGIIKTVPKLIQAAFTLIAELVGGLAKKIPEIIVMGGKLVGKLVVGLLGALGKVGEAALNIGKELINGVGGFVTDMISAGKDLIGGLAQGIADMKDKAINKVKEVGSNIASTLKSFFGIKSPSRMFRYEIGRMLGEGLILGMGDELSAIAKMAQKVSEAATPEQPKLAGFEVGDFRGHAQQVSAELSANAANGSEMVASNDTYNFRGMLEGSTFIVREEADIDRIAEQLAQKVRETKARKGIR